MEQDNLYINEWIDPGHSKFTRQKHSMSLRYCNYYELAPKISMTQFFYILWLYVSKVPFHMLILLTLKFVHILEGILIHQLAVHLLLN